MLRKVLLAAWAALMLAAAPGPAAATVTTYGPDDLFVDTSNPGGPTYAGIAFTPYLQKQAVYAKVYVQGVDALNVYFGGDLDFLADWYDVVDHARTDLTCGLYPGDISEGSGSTMKCFNRLGPHKFVGALDTSKFHFDRISSTCDEAHNSLLKYPDAEPCEQFVVITDPYINVIVNGEVEHPNIRMVLSDVPFVPEPQTWALMIAGFGLAGVALRRRIFQCAHAPRA